MAFSLQINHSTCIRCKKCVQVCPSGIFTLPKEKNEVTCQYVSDCIFCGHCVTVCPTGSVEHSVFPPETIHPIDRSSLPSPEQVLLLCRARRSNRALSPDPVPQESLEQILEAAHRAPTASNSQKIQFTLITNPKLLQQIGDLTIDVFSSLKKKLTSPIIKPVIRQFAPEIYGMIPRFERLEREHREGNDPILRKATALIFIHAPSSSRFGAEDANLAYQNASLMAESLGVSQIYTGFVCTAIKQDKEHRIKKLLEIDGKIHAGMAMGLPKFYYPNYMDKKNIDLKIWK